MSEDVGMNDVVLISNFGACAAFVHMNMGLAVYVLAKLALRTRRASVFALVAVGTCAVLAALGEVIHFRPDRPLWVAAGVVTTIFWPTLEYLVTSHRRQRWQFAQMSRELNNFRKRPGIPS